MRIGLAADLHLDDRLGTRRDAEGVNVRVRDHERAFSQVIDGFIRTEVEAVVIAGDIFDTARPPERSRQFFIHEINRLAAARPAMPIIIDEGNHDVEMRFSDATVLSTLALAMPSAVTVVANYRPAVVDLSERVRLHVVPWMRSDDEFLATLANLRPRPGRGDLLILHCGLAELAQFAALTPGSQTLTRALLPEGFAHLFSGHFHGYRDLPELGFTFIGSSERTSSSEVGTDKGFLTYDTETWRHTFHAVTTRPWYDLGQVDAADWDGARLLAELTKLREGLPDWSEAIVRARFVNLAPAVYATMPRDEIRALKASAFYDNIEIRPAESSRTAAVGPTAGAEEIGLDDLGAEFRRHVEQMVSRSSAEREAVTRLGLAALVGESLREGAAVAAAA